MVTAEQAMSSVVHTSFSFKLEYSSFLLEEWMIVGRSLAANTCCWSFEVKVRSRMGLVPRRIFFLSEMQDKHLKRDQTTLVPTWQ